jgi:hypothetical protein
MLLSGLQSLELLGLGKEILGTRKEIFYISPNLAQYSYGLITRFTTSASKNTLAVSRVVLFLKPQTWQNKS